MATETTSWCDGGELSATFKYGRLQRLSLAGSLHGFFDHQGAGPLGDEVPDMGACDDLLGLLHRIDPEDENGLIRGLSERAERELQNDRRVSRHGRSLVWPGPWAMAL